MSSVEAEKLVKKLARSPSNTKCPDCGVVKKFGFSTVCIKYHTFVCNDCKSSHQAYSHRCKSLTMSSWTDAEVAELKRKGNDYALRTWLKNAPPVGQGGRPKEGDHIDVFKRFIVDVYERKRYFGEDEGIATARAAAASQQVAARAPTRTRAPVHRAVPPSAPPPAPVAVDLLDFGCAPSITSGSTDSNNGNFHNTFKANFDTFAPAASVPSSGHSTGAKAAAAPTTNDPFQPHNTQSAKVSNDSGGNFVANFDAFAPAASVPSSGSSAGSQTAATPIKNDPFQPQMTQTTASSNGSSFNFINNNAISASEPMPPPPQKKPVMNNCAMNQKSSLISSISMPATSNIQQRQNNMVSGVGWNNNNTSFGGPNSMTQMQQQMMMQQQQLNNMMNGMSINNMGGIGMMNMNNNNPMMAMGNNNNNMMMMMGNNNINNNMMMMGNSGNPPMMNQQRNMMNGNTLNGMTNNVSGKSQGSMESLQMNSSSMNAWSSGSNM